MVEFKPYISEARYFKVFIESDGSVNSITQSDIEGLSLTSNQWAQLPANFRLLDIIEDIHCVAAESAVNRLIDIRINADGTESFFIPSSANFDYATFYVLGYTDD